MADKFSFKRAASFAVPAIIFTAIDQWTQILTLDYLKGSDPVVLIKNVLELLYVENRGAAFGIMYGMKSVFVVLAAVITCAAFYMFMHMPVNKRFIPFNAALILVSAGAIGNVIDRIRLGYVVDFIYFMPIDFPVFNFADICVTGAAFLIIFLFLFVYKENDIQQIPFFGNKDHIR